MARQRGTVGGGVLLGLLIPVGERGSGEEAGLTHPVFGRERSCSACTLEDLRSPALATAILYEDRPLG
jgi:hypothetical protein